MKSSDEHFEWDRRVLARWSLQNKNMPVDSINSYGPELPIRPASKRSTAPADFAAAADSFDTTAFLQSAQDRAATSRPEKIARAQALLADENYPSEKVLKQLAGFLTEKL